MQLSKNKIKQITSLSRKKYRQEYGLFVAEGEKLVAEILASQLRIESIVALPGWLEKNAANTRKHTVIETNEAGMKKVSHLKTPPCVLAVVNLPPSGFEMTALRNQLLLLLDNIQDPGNLGTILRTADWFGIQNIICSQATADAFNPKVVQATMGAIARVRVIYTDLPAFADKLKTVCSTPVYGMFLGGKAIHKQQLPAAAAVVIGNEGQGISAAMEKQIDEKLQILSFLPQDTQAESLNAAIATAITCYEFRRKASD